MPTDRCPLTKRGSPISRKLMNASHPDQKKNAPFFSRFPRVRSLTWQKNLVLFLILPVLFVSFLGGEKMVRDSSGVLRSLHDNNFITADLEGFLTIFSDLSGQASEDKSPLKTENMRLRGYLLHAQALLRDAQSRSRSLSIPERNQIDDLLQKTDQLLRSDLKRSAPRVRIDALEISRSTLPLLLELSRSTDKALQIAKTTSRKILLLQSGTFFLFLVLIVTLLVWLERYRRFLKKMAIDEALNVSVTGIAILPLSMDRFLYINKGFEDLSGFRSEELCQKTNPPFDPAFGRPDLPEAISTLLQGTKKYIGFSTILTNRQKKQIPVYVRLELTDFEEQRQIVATLDDRTEESRLRQDLEFSRNHLHTLVRHLGEGVMEIDPQGNVLSLNATGERLLGFRSEDLSGSAAHPLFVKAPSVFGDPGEESDFLHSRIRASLVSSEPVETESCFLKKRDGSLLACSLLFTPIYTSSGGNLKELVVIFRDIGPRRRLQKNLQKNEEKYRKMIQSSPDGILLVNPVSLLILEANPAFADMVGVHFTETLPGRPVDTFLPGGTIRFPDLLRTLRSGGASDAFISRLFHRDRCSIPVSVRAILFPYEEEEVLLLIVRDITLQTHSESVRRILHQLDQRILENRPIEGVFSALAEDLLQSFSLGIAALVRRNPDGDMTVLALSSALEDGSGEVERTLTALMNEEPSSSAARQCLAAGERQIFTPESYPEPYKTFFRRNHIEASVFFPVRLPGTRPQVAIGISAFSETALDSTLLSLMEDLSDKLAIAFLHESEQRQIRLQKIATEAVDTPLFIAGPGGTFEWANKAYLDSKGCSFEEIPDFPGYYFSRQTGRTFSLENPLWKTLRAGETYIQEYTSLRKGGESYPVEIRISPVFGEDRELLHMVCIEKNLSDRKQEEEELRKKAYFDPLTHLANRHLMEGELSRSIEVARRNNMSMAVLFLDLDGFKEVNDNHGHEFGDKLLVHVAGRLEKLIRHGDLVSRLGGDEFVVILNNIRNPAEVRAAAGRILAGIQAPYLIDGQTMIIGTSIGISVYPNEDKDPSSLLREADQAMYLAKNRGKNNFVLYTPPSEEINDGQTGIPKESFPSLPERLFTLAPVRSLNSGEIAGFSLSTAQSERQTLYGEDAGRILPYEEKKRFFEHARNVWENIQHTYPGAFLKISLSAHQVMEADFFSVFSLVLGDLGPEERSRFFIGLHGNIPFPGTYGQDNSISRLTEEGFAIGTERVGDQGNTLFQLRYLPVRFLEVSGTLIRDMAHEANDLAVLGSIFLLGSSLDKKLIVPGVEDIETALILKRLGFDWCSGTVCGGEIPHGDPGKTALRDTGWKKFSEDFHSRWDPENISYLLGRKNHREEIEALSKTEELGEGPPLLSGHPSGRPCPFQFWLQQKSTSDLLGALNVSQWRELEEKFHHLTTGSEASLPDSTRPVKNRVESLKGVQAEMQRLQVLAENVLFGSVIPEKI